MPGNGGRGVLRPGALAVLGAAILLSSMAPGAAAQDDMAVKMQWDETLYRSEVSRVNLEITNIHPRSPMNVTSAGLYIDWMKLGTFAENTTPLRLESGERGVMTIFFRVPVDASYGKHSDYVVVRYSLKNDTSGRWESKTFESVINKDFTVVERPGKEQDWLALSPDNPLCLAGLVVAIVIAVAAAGAAAARARRRRIMVEPATPPPAPEPVPPPPPTPPPEVERPEGPEKCPYCGAPWPGKHCPGCGWDLG
ncbi:MAG: hypothetical protein FJ149_03590 [Euryarchaeota archaeon]|nr:hypothetical protein [Euryarchaeota archaeon]